MFQNCTVWIYAVASVIAISFCGLLCLGLVPVFTLCCFDYIYQFFISLALGSLCSHTLVNLIHQVNVIRCFVPYIIVKQTNILHINLHTLKDLTNHIQLETNKFQLSENDMYKGVLLVAGVYFSFFVEKLLRIRISSIKRV